MTFVVPFLVSSLSEDGPDDLIQWRQLRFHVRRRGQRRLECENNGTVNQWTNGPEDQRTSGRLESMDSCTVKGWATMMIDGIRI